MQVYERAERQVEKLNQIVPEVEKTVVATTKAISDFAAATTTVAVEETTQKALTSFRANECSWENVSGLLQDLSDLFQGLTDTGNSNAGAEQLRSLQKRLVDADTELSKLAGKQLVSFLRQAEHGTNTKGPANLQSIGAILLRLSTMVDLVKAENDFNRNLVLTLSQEET